MYNMYNGGCGFLQRHVLILLSLATRLTTNCLDTHAITLKILYFNTVLILACILHESDHIQSGVVKEGGTIRQSPGNNRIGMKQYCQPIAAGITCSVS